MDTGQLVAGVLAISAICAFLQLVWGYAQIPLLRDVPPGPVPAPKVSIVVAARDEERHVESATTSLLQQAYPDFELIVVDDRSSDRTLEILERIAESDARLQVATIEALPAGWLGKNNAMRVGAERASGELLLFADADVVLERQALSRAVRLLQLEHADHVTVVPEMVLPQVSLAMLVNYGFMWGFLATRPWKTRDPRSSASLGIGAFNLVRASAYRAIGGHSRIPLRPDDDLMLGKLLKRAGFRQIVAGGVEQVSVEWYRTLGEAARGFRKNAFAALRYSALAAIGVPLATIGFAVWPFVAVWLTGGAERVLYATAALAQMAAYAYQAHKQRSRPWLAITYPIAALCAIGIISAAVARTLRRRGIEWRGTFYSLDELRANRI
ncbi:MAG: glycosyltransferase family 2 protein [Gemmatimonadaceae bacterium]